MLRTLAIIGSIALILITLVDCFDTIVLPRRVRRLFRYVSSMLRQGKNPEKLENSSPTS